MLCPPPRRCPWRSALGDTVTAPRTLTALFCKLKDLRIAPGKDPVTMAEPAASALRPHAASWPGCGHGSLCPPQKSLPRGPSQGGLAELGTNERVGWTARGDLPESRSDTGENCFPTGQQAVEAGAQGETAPRLPELLAENPRNFREAKISLAQNACTNKDKVDSIKIKTLLSEDERSQVKRQTRRSCILNTRRTKGLCQECLTVSEQLGCFHDGEDLNTCHERREC